MTALHDLAVRLAAWEAGGDAVGPRTFDTMGALLAGAATAEGRAIAASPPGWESGVSAAVVRRVAIARMTELDDIHMASGTTPGAVVVPTAITLAAWLGVDSDAYRRAVAAGYEAMTRLGAAISGAHAVYRGLWPTYFCAPVATATVAATLLDLDPGRLATALGIALTRATGLTSGIVGAPLARWLTVGDAARAGCSAAFAARDGFAAEVDLERVATAAGIALEPAALRSDAPPAIDAVSVKPFPTAKQSLAAVEATLLLAGDGARGRIRVHVPEAYARMIAGPPLPDSRLSRVSSARWNVALALLAPDELHDVARGRAVDDPQLAPVAAGVEVLADPELSRLFPARWPARVELDGRTETIIDASGDPPANGLSAIEAKWRARPEEVQALRAAALDTDVPRLAALLDAGGDGR
jgi:2-methylcitrate dehydratase PrpD